MSVMQTIVLGTVGSIIAVVALSAITPWGRCTMLRFLLLASSGCRVMEGFPRYTVCLRLRIEWEWIRNIRLNYRIRGRKAGAKDWSWTMQNDNCVAIFPKPFVYDVVRNTNPGMAVVDSPERYPDSHFLPEGEPWEIEVRFFKSGVFVHKQKILVSVKKPDNEESVTFIAMKM